MLCPDIPGPLNDLIERMMAKDPDGRPPTAAASRGKTSHSSMVGRMCSGDRLSLAMSASAFAEDNQARVAHQLEAAALLELAERVAVADDRALEVADHHHAVHQARGLAHGLPAIKRRSRSLTIAA